MSGVVPGAWNAPKTAEAAQRLKNAQRRNWELRQMVGALAVLRDIQFQGVIAETADDNSTSFMHQELECAVNALEHAIEHARRRRNPPRTVRRASQTPKHRRPPQ